MNGLFTWHFQNRRQFPDGSLASFESVIQPIIEQLTTLTFSNQKLRAARDLLLPRLIQSGVVQTSGKTSGMLYFVAPEWLRGAQLDRKTTLSRISPHRLIALILEDLSRYPDSSTTDVNRRIGAEISAKTVKRALDDLVGDGRVTYEGERRWRRYRVSAQEHKGQEAGEFS